MSHAIPRWCAALRPSLALACLGCAGVLNAQTIWTGSEDNSWANPANWTAGVPSSLSVSPAKVRFSSNDLNADSLTLDGTYYINQLTIDKADYGTTEKALMNAGTAGSKLIFVADGATMPTLNIAMLTDAEPTSPTDNTPRSFLFGADIELASDLTLTRTGGTGSITSPYANRLRRLLFTGVISGSGKLTISSNSTSNAGHIAFQSHNTFTGDIEMRSGYLLQKYADSLGPGDKTITFGAAGSITWDLTSTSIVQGDRIGYDLVLPTSTSYNLLINAGTAQRQLVFTGDMSGAANHTASQRALWLIGQRNQQLVFDGESMTFGGLVYARLDTEIVVSKGNESGVAWENVKKVSLNQEVTGTTTALNNNSAFLLRGDLTFKGPIEIADGESTAATPARDIVSIGQINHNGTSYDAVFESNITTLENDYRALNLVSETGGSATFTGDILVAGDQGWLVNQIINSATSGGSLNFYEATPTGTVIIGAGGRVAQAATGTVSAGVAEIQRGTLLVNTDEFFSSTDVKSGARLGGSGLITGSVTVRNGGLLEPGTGSTAPSFSSQIGTLSVTGNVTLESGASLILQVAGPTFNLGTTPVEDMLTVFASQLETVGDHDHLDLSGTLTVSAPGTIQYSPVGDYIISYGDAFHLLDFASLSIGSLTTDQIFSLPDVSLLNPAWSWNYDYFADYGLVVVVPEPSRCLLLALGLVGGMRVRRRG
ncbi:PEP-CTERM protein-sorting domain-containing protein [Prosthecobacter debontii]|uniref:PEP-CTERM protein-sorting domain-containing protein n=1 Tax=Prosthecobacter debontii TaxID=48467 RepID=A0A1T4Z252_9BACT|nr:PEP-CTERM sorting domain-containing protein [Prosthecobacter debontii]SKB07641.1 PEP-CTERM protein-sorting domain-containing protein [Prosthecobacter debontii]